MFHFDRVFYEITQRLMHFIGNVTCDVSTPSFFMIDTFLTLQSKALEHIQDITEKGQQQKNEIIK